MFLWNYFWPLTVLKMSKKKKKNTWSNFKEMAYRHFLFWTMNYLWTELPVVEQHEQGCSVTCFFEMCTLF